MGLVPLATVQAQFSTGSSSPSGFSAGVLSNTHYFAASDGKGGAELWKTQLTQASTVLVKDIRPGPKGSHPQHITPDPLGGTVFFVANDGTGGRELWKTDGTAAGTKLVKDIRSGSVGSLPNHLTWVGTTTLFFVANNGTNGRELWKTDGTAAGTSLVKDIRSGSAGSHPHSLVAFGSNVVFVANNGTNGTELWKSDGTPAGTALIKDIRSGTGHASPTDLVIGPGGFLYFAASDAQNGRELWRSDGTAAGTVVVDIRAGAGSSAPSQIVAGLGRLFFTANDGTHGRELWQSNGTAAGTTLVRDIRSGLLGSKIVSLVSAGFSVWFGADDGASGTELWKSDGTLAGTFRVKDIVPGSGSSHPRSLTPMGASGLVFSAETPANGREIWRSDSTAAGTILLRDIRSGSLSSRPNFLFRAALTSPSVLFAAERGSDGREVWKTDGTPATTQLLSDIDPATPGPDKHIQTSPTQVRVDYSNAALSSFVVVFGAARPIEPVQIPGFGGFLRLDPLSLFSIAVIGTPSGNGTLLIPFPPRALKGSLVLQALNLTPGPSALVSAKHTDSASVQWNSCAVVGGCGIWSDGGWLDDQSFDFVIPVHTDCPLANTTCGCLALVLIENDGVSTTETLLETWEYCPGSDGNLILQREVPLVPPEGAAGGFQIELRWFPNDCPPTPPSGGCKLYQVYC